MDSNDRLSRERHDMERELSTSRSHRGAQHGLPSIPPLGASGSSRHPPPPPASGGGGGLIRMGEVTSANGDSRSRDSRGHPSLPKPLGMPPRKRNRSPSPTSSYHSKGGSRSTRGDSYEPSRDRSRDYDYDYGYDSTSRGASRSRGDDYDAYYSSRSGYPEDSYGSSRRRRGSLGHDDYDPYYDRGHSRGGYDDYAYDRAYDYERSHHDDSYYDYGYGYDDYGRGGRDPREADHWLGSASDPDPTSKSTKSTGVFDPFKNSGLLNFKSFAALAKAANHPSVDLKDKLFAEYTTYRLEFQKRLLRTFFESNYDRVWFKEKYSNTVVDGIDYAADRKERVKKGRSGRKNHWLQELRAGEIDGVCWDLRTASKEVIEEDTAPVDPRDSGVPVGFKGPAAASFTRNGRERIQHENAIIPPDPTLLFILSLPPDQSRKGLEAVLEKQPGYQYLALGEPNPMRQGMRVAWAKFDDGVDTEALVTKLNPISVNNSGMPQVGSSTIPLGLVIKRATARLRVMPEQSTSLKRMRYDLFQARRLISLFEEQDRSLFLTETSPIVELDVDCISEIYKRVREMKDGELGQVLDEEEAREKLVEDKWKNSEDKSLAIVRDSGEAGTSRDLNHDDLKVRKEVVRTLLDLSIDCLRQVYNFDYYSTTKAEFPEELLRRATLCIRKCPEDGTQIEENKDGRDGSQEEFWSKGLDEKLALLLDPEVDLVPHGGVNLQDWLLEEAKVWVQEAGPEKFRCTVEVPAPPPDEKTLTQQCGKLFKGSMFVQKHVVNKHRAFLDEKTATKLEKEKLFNQYVSDPGRPMSHYHVNKKAAEPLKDQGRSPASSQSKSRNMSHLAAGNNPPIRFGASTAAEPPRSSQHSNGGGGDFLIRLGPARPSINSDFEAGVGPRSGSGFKYPNSNGDASLSSRLGPKQMATNGNGFNSSSSSSSNNRNNGQNYQQNQNFNQNFNNGFSTALDKPQPLPTNVPQKVDPRASKQQSYHDLDGPATGAEELELNY